jgi:hypothetical protein
MVIRLCAEAIAFLPPLCLSGIVLWLQNVAGAPAISAPSSSAAFFEMFSRAFGSSTFGVGVALASCMFAAGVVNPILIQWHHYMITRIGMHMRTALTCVCHAHLLRSSGDALQGMGLGMAINICCADAERVEMYRISSRIRLTLNISHVL